MGAVLRCGVPLVCVLAMQLSGCARVASAPEPGTGGKGATDPLASWNDTAAKSAIVDLVRRVTAEGTPGYVPPEERIAVFDNDGTLWAEQPMYFQGLFALDRLRAMAGEHPEWAGREPFRSALGGDLKAVAASGHRAVLELLLATHAGMTPEAFEGIVAEWLRTARHPVKNRPYTDLVYQPMLEVLAYLRANGFRTYIVSGGGTDFIRVFAQRVYGVPPEQVIGSTIVTRYEMKEGRAQLVRVAELEFVDDKEGKPIAIHKFIGRRPLVCFGNSDGDLQMLEYTTTGPRPGIGFIVRHDDADREWAYDRQSHVGKLDRALDEAGRAGWHVVRMSKDWGRVFPYEPAASK